jgi:hypothetical protein
LTSPDNVLTLGMVPRHIAYQWPKGGRNPATARTYPQAIESRFSVTRNF